MILSREASHPGDGDLQFLILNAHQDIHAGINGCHIALAQGSLGCVAVYRDGVLKPISKRGILIIAGIACVISLLRSTQIFGNVWSGAGEDLEFGVYPVGVQDVDRQPNRIYRNAGVGETVAKGVIVRKALRLADMGACHGIHQSGLDSYTGIAKIIFGEDAGLIAILSPGIFLRGQAGVAIGLPIIKGRERALNTQAKLCET